MTTDERLARLEVKMDMMSDLIKDFIDVQDAHNKTFFSTRDDVRDMQANAKGAWFIIGIFGTLTVTVAGTVSWLVTYIKG